jgi:RNA polymerase sigma-70 factor (ECF subfamily)
MLNDDRSLMIRSRQGDRDAFAELMRRYQGAVFNAAYRLLGNRQDAEDAAQEAFVRALRALGTFDIARPPAPWLKKIVVNVCLSWLDGAPPATSELDEESDVVAPAGSLPENVAQTHSLQRRLRAEILRLPPRYRAVIELRHFQELTYEEIAQTLRRPLSDVKSDLFRARRLLAGRLKDVGDS